MSTTCTSAATSEHLTTRNVRTWRGEVTFADSAPPARSPIGARCARSGPRRTGGAGSRTRTVASNERCPAWSPSALWMLGDD